MGFSENDAIVYTTLAELGPSSSNPIISKSNLHRSLVYTSLDHLVTRKLVSTKDIKGKKHFAITSPSLLVQEYDEKQILAKKVADDIEKKISVDIQEITVHQGNDEYLALLSSIIKMMPKGSTKYVMGTGGEKFMNETMKPIWKKYHKVAHEAQIKIKMIGYENQKESFLKEVEKEKIYDVKFLPSNMENPAGIHIYPELNIVLNIIYSDSHKPVTAIKIKDKDLTKGYLNLFQNLWETGKS